MYGSATKNKQNLISQRLCPVAELRIRLEVDRIRVEVDRIRVEVNRIRVEVDLVLKKKPKLCNI